MDLIIYFFYRFIPIFLKIIYCTYFLYKALSILLLQIWIQSIILRWNPMIMIVQFSF